MQHVLCVQPCSCPKWLERTQLENFGTCGGCRDVGRKEVAFCTVMIRGGRMFTAKLIYLYLPHSFATSRIQSEHNTLGPLKQNYNNNVH